MNECIASKSSPISRKCGPSSNLNSHISKMPSSCSIELTTLNLADKLSEGDDDDDDGNLNWVCWGSRTVDNFQNTDIQKRPKFLLYMPRRNKEEGH